MCSKTFDPRLVARELNTAVATLEYPKKTSAKRGRFHRPICEQLEGRRLLSFAIGTLGTFTGSNGNYPSGGLTADASGNLYGTTQQGGEVTSANANGYGTVFEISATTHIFSTIATFSGTDGQEPKGGVLVDNAGNIYGTTYGSTTGYGTVFELTSGTHALTTLTTFNQTDGQWPEGNLVMDTFGNIYGTTAYIGTGGGGSIFELAAGSRSLSTLATFPVMDADSAEPGGLIVDGSGNLYGVTSYGGANNVGSIFEISSSTHVFSTLATFNGTNGNNPNLQLVEDASGNLYGTTQSGVNGTGSVFEYDAATATLNTLVGFSDSGGPAAGVSIDSSENLYGTTQYGGTNGFGTAFEIAANTTTLTTLAIFTGSDTGKFPSSSLISDSTGKLFGTTFGDSIINDGTVFELTPNSNPTSTQLAFGQQPSATLAGSTIVPAVVVHIQNSNGSDVATDNSMVSLSASGGATLGGTTTVAAVNGVATFSDLTLSMPGTYTLTATDGSLTSATSTSFNITADILNNSPLTPTITRSTLPATIVGGSKVHLVA